MIKGPEGVKLTPMLEHYLQVKAEHPDALLFYRMGDFFELFFEDAHTASRELSITLTSRNPDSPNPVPMAGIPHHALEGYVGQLLARGMRIVICDQVEDPKLAKGLVKREVTRVLTPGTVVEDANLSAKEHHYLAALYWDDAARSGGLCWCEFSTGEWTGLTLRDPAVAWQWVAKLAPKELLLPEDPVPPRCPPDLGVPLTRLPRAMFFDQRKAESKILSNQGVADLHVLDLSAKPELVCAMGALVAYLEATQRAAVGHLQAFRVLRTDKTLLLDEVTERNLELFRRLDGKKGPGTLWHVLDRTVTSMGGRRLESLLHAPSTDPRWITEQQEAVDALVRRETLRQDLRGLLKTMADLERISTRVALGRALPRDFSALRDSLAVLPRIKAVLTAEEAQEAPLPEGLVKLAASLDTVDDVSALLARALADAPPPSVTEGGLFRTGFDAGLDELIELTERGEAKIRELADEESAKAGLPRLKLGYNRVFGYYFELSRSAGAPPPHFVRRQTLANAERYVTEELTRLEERLSKASQERKDLEYALFGRLRATVAEARPRLLAASGLVARLDAWLGLAQAACEHDWVRPELAPGLDLLIEDGRHPVVEAALGGRGYVPSSLSLGEARRLMLITGPNMAGKSTVLRQAALIVLLAQIGSFVPASRARIGLADRIFCRVGASDNLAKGQSTFMVEMMETARILRHATKKSLVILDEIGRGTATFDGLALAWSVAEDLCGPDGDGVRTLFATHYHELTALEGRLPGLVNANTAVKEWKGDIIFLRRLVPGPADRSYGIEVARLAGVPARVVGRAKEILTSLERGQKSPACLGGSTARPPRAQLPGLAEPPAAHAPDRHPLLVDIAELDLPRLTPLDALNLLGEYQKRLAEDEQDG